MTMEPSDHPTGSSDAIEKPPVSQAPNTGSDSVKPAAGSAAADNAGNTGEGVNTRGSAASQGGDGDGATINALEPTQIDGTAYRNGHAPLERHIFSGLMVWFFRVFRPAIFTDIRPPWERRGLTNIRLR